VSKEAIDESTSQAKVLLREGRSFETASLPRGFEKELARLEVWSLFFEYSALFPGVANLASPPLPHHTYWLLTWLLRLLVTA